jgi:hypothetical protein
MGHRDASPVILCCTDNIVFKVLVLAVGKYTFCHEFSVFINDSSDMTPPPRKKIVNGWIMHIRETLLQDHVH